MEELWLKVSKPAKDGKKYIVLKGVNDLGFLYVSGFVDISKYGFKEWIDAFKGSRTPTGSFIVTHEQWLEKKKFRYDGKIGIPYDPMTMIEEKDYTEAEVTKLLTEKIIPNTIYSAAYVPQVVNNLKAQGKLAGGKIFIDKKVKEFVGTIINTYPSPRRILELMVAALKDQKKNKNQLSQAEAQKSSFAAGSTAQSIVQARLAELAKEVKAAESVQPSGPTLSLKDLAKKRPGGSRI